MDAKKNLSRSEQIRAALCALLFAFLALLTTGSTALAATFTVTADRDSTLNEDKPTELNGSDTKLSVFANSAGAKRKTAIYGFTLPTIPSTEIMVTATLILRVEKQGPETISLYRVTDSWTESTVNWSNTGLDFASPAVTTFTAPNDNVFLNVPITSLVRQWYDGAFVNHGLVLIGAASSDMEFTAREWGTVSERPMLSITTVVKPVINANLNSTAISDPVNGTTNPKRIPSSIVQYALQVTNSANGTTDSNTTSVSQAVPTNMTLYVGDLGAAGSGPVIFANGTPSSGLSYSFISLASSADNLAFSNNGGTTFTYTPVPDVDGYDLAVTNLQVSPTGSFAPKTGGTDPSFTITLRMRTK